MCCCKAYNNIQQYYHTAVAVLRTKKGRLNNERGLARPANKYCLSYLRCCSSSATKGAGASRSCCISMAHAIHATTTAVSIYRTIARRIEPAVLRFETLLCPSLTQAAKSVPCISRHAPRPECVEQRVVAPPHTSVHTLPHSNTYLLDMMILRGLFF